MRSGIEEPDTQALISTLRALAANPARFSPASTSIVAAMAANALGGPPAMSATSNTSMQCPGQMSIDDYDKAWEKV